MGEIGKLLKKLIRNKNFLLIFLDTAKIRYKSRDKFYYFNFKHALIKLIINKMREITNILYLKLSDHRLRDL